MPRNQERTRAPNISQLARELGFTDAKFFSKMLMDFWLTAFPNSQFADVSDEQVINIADDFLETKGREIWSQRGRGPVYPDEKDSKIKPRLIAILKRQRRNQLDVRIKKVRKLQDDENDEIYHLENDHSLNTPEATIREVNELESTPQAQALAPSFAQPAPPSTQLSSPRAHTARSPLRSEFSEAPEVQNFRAFSAPAGNPRKRAFEEISGSALHASKGPGHAPTAQKRATPENMEPEPMPYFVNPKAGHEGPRPLPSRSGPSKQNDPAQTGQIGSPIPRQSMVGDTPVSCFPTNAETTVVTDDAERGRIANRGTPVQRSPRATNGSLGSNFGTASTPVLQSQSPPLEIQRIDPALADEHQKGRLGTEMEVSDREPSTRPQAESFSSFLFDNSYSIEANQAPRLVQWFLDYCDEKKNDSAKTMRRATTGEDKSLARTKFLLFRELLEAFKGEMLRAGARLEL